MSIELKDVEHLAGLARIAVSEDEKKILQHDLEEVLRYVSQIKEEGYTLDKPEVGSLYNVLRPDEAPHEAGAFTEDLLAQAPARKGDHVVVKKIL